MLFSPVYFRTSTKREDLRRECTEKETIKITHKKVTLFDIGTHIDNRPNSGRLFSDLNSLQTPWGLLCLKNFS